MSTISGKQIVLGVTGSIAAYKACEIASLLVKRGVHVIPVLTHSAMELVRPASFEAITGNRAITGMFDTDTTLDVDHINVAQRVDAFIVAPATANIIAKHAVGIADDWLTTALLATRAPILFAPAMNTQMYEHSATQENISILRLRGCKVIEPVSGILACKTVGIGKMADPQDIVDAALPLIARNGDLRGKKVLITSGANHEPIDPVRFIGNRSSGKMGRALALEALRRGATVTVVTGPAEVMPPHGAEVICVQTAGEMFDAVMDRVRLMDIVIGAAAVSDFRVENPSAEKHKRNGKSLEIRLAENPDIIAEAAAARKNGQIFVGFAAETHDHLENARAKRVKKGLDLIVANDVGGERSAFGADAVDAAILDASNHTEDLPNVSKDVVAERLFDRIVALGKAAPVRV